MRRGSTNFTGAPKQTHHYVPNDVRRGVTRPRRINFEYLAGGLAKAFIYPSADSPPRGGNASTAHAKGAIRRLDFHVGLVLGARAKPECAARSLNNRAAAAFVRIIDELIEPDL